MSGGAKKQMKQLKSEDFVKWDVSFWLIKKKQALKKTAYAALRVDMDQKLQMRFRRYLTQQLQGRDFHIEPYDYNNADGDDALFTIDADATDFSIVAMEIAKGFNNKRVSRYDDLLRSWAYVILFEKDGRKLYAWKKISADTQPKKATAKDLTFFLNKKLVDLDDKEVFVIYPNYDFFVYDNTTFIANKRQFESSMNFREGMMANGREVLLAFEALDIFEGIDIIRNFVGVNMHHLRKLSSIRKAGYYKQPNYMKKLILVNEKEKWELKIDNGKIVVEEETVELLLKLLNNDRLRSPINDELFDAAAKALVSGKMAAK